MTDREYMARLLDSAATLLDIDLIQRPARNDKGKLDPRWRPEPLGPALAHECFKDAQGGTPEARAYANLQLYEWYRTKSRPAS
jgi:hypothetical protein